MNELGKSYVDFMRGNLDILRQKIIDELFVLSIFEVGLQDRSTIFNLISIHALISTH